jgi:hypothetical protein
VDTKKNAVDEEEQSTGTKDEDVPVAEVSLNTETRMSSDAVQGGQPPSEVATARKLNTGVLAMAGENQERRAPTINRASWQFQALMGQVKARNGRPEQAASQQLLGETQTQAPTQPGGSCDSSCDDETWSQVSKGEGSDPVMIGGDAEESVSSACDKSWQKVAAAADEDGWSDVEPS